MKSISIRKKRHTSQFSQNLLLSGICFLLCLLLPILSDHTNLLSPSLRLSHIPVLLCGFLCGWPYGLAVGFLSSLLRGLLFSIPLVPDCLSLATELAAYGAMAGLMYHFLPKRLDSLYTALVISMITGRVLWGVTRLIFSLFGAPALTLEAFWSYAVTSGIPGIFLSLLVVPLLILAVQQIHFINRH